MRMVFVSRVAEFARIQKGKRGGLCAFILALVLMGISVNVTCGQDESVSSEVDRFGSRPLLTDAQWNKLDNAVDRALTYLARMQDSDGSYRTDPSGQPAVTALATMAYLSRGHLPDEGQYSTEIQKGVDYVLSMQAPDGAITLRRVGRDRAAHFEGNYNHAISGLMLTEVYGMTSTKRQKLIQEVIENALAHSRTQQTMTKRFPDDRGGWRYMQRFGDTDSDLSITAWQLMFLRSARNAEFEIPEEWIDEAMGYVRRTFDKRKKGFRYGLRGEDDYVSRGMVGAGVVSLSLGGEHNTEIAQQAGQWILNTSFDQFNRSIGMQDRYHYGAYYCSQAMYQLGGDYWFEFYPKLLDAYVENQNRDGSWDSESYSNDRKYGPMYSTALAVLALTPPYQILPIYQR
ncbi:MAG: terpene cyclase/mutase family protein [Planctomycetaceae bacterium]|nr:terpene cyclase/mutase family protein [Planctomycetaceae bacterium]